MSRKEPTEPHQDFDQAVHQAALELLGQARDTVNEHPEIDDLIAYQEGRLGPQEAEKIQRHLERCVDCEEELSEISTLGPTAPVNSDYLPDRESTAEDWVELQSRLRRAKSSEAAHHAPDWVSMTNRADKDHASQSPSSWPRWALAASLALTMIASFFLGQNLGLKNEEKLAGFADFTLPFPLDLYPDAEGRQRGGPAIETMPPVGADVFIVRLFLGDLTPHETYRAEIFTAEGVSAWSRESLHRQPTGDFLFLVPAEFLPAGSYRLELMAGSQEDLLAMYSFELLAALNE